jgi:dipeptidyl aminopeptidase/acylaminoacyl peptidase
MKGTEHLFRVTVADAKIEQVTHGDRVISQASIAGNRMAYTNSTTDRPVEVYTASLPAAGGFAVGERKVSSVSDALLATWQLGKVERVHYDSKDGTSIDGWVVLPPGYEQGQRNYPMVLTIHGGPHAAYTSAFAFKEQLLAAVGYVVLYTNPRRLCFEALPRGPATVGRDRVFVRRVSDELDHWTHHALCGSGGRRRAVRLDQ